MRYSLEKRFRIFNDDCGERIEIGDDPDGLDLTEIVWVGDDGKRGTNICFTDEAILLLIEALAARLNRNEPTRIK
jgi:hypothetical protein